MEAGAGGLFLFLLVAMSVFINVMWRLGEHLLSVRNVPKETSDWNDEVKRVLIALIDTDLDRHNLLARLAHLVGKQPEGYDSLARDAFTRMLLVQPALAKKSEEVGLFPRGTFERMGVPEYDSFMMPPSPSSPAQLSVVEAGDAEEPYAFVGTVQVPRQ